MRRNFLILAVPGTVALALVACTRADAPGTPSAIAPAPSETTAAAGVRPAGDSSGAQTGVWVNGTGSVRAQPDLAMLSLGVESRGKTVEEARAKGADAMNAVMASLTKDGIAQKDIQTHSFNISPEYNFVDRADGLGRRTERVLIGYLVTNQVSVKVRALDSVGRVIDNVAKAGGDLTRINGVSFTIDDPAPLRRQARDKAVADAVAKADQIARAAGVSLGRAFYLNESGGAPPPPQPPFAVRALAAEAGGAPTPISGGELEITVSVQAAFSIR